MGFGQRKWSCKCGWTHSWSCKHCSHCGKHWQDSVIPKHDSQAPGRSKWTFDEVAWPKPARAQGKGKDQRDSTPSKEVRLEALLNSAKQVATAAGQTGTAERISSIHGSVKAENAGQDASGAHHGQPQGAC